MAMGGRLGTPEELEMLRAGKVPEGKTLVFSVPASPAPNNCPDCPWGDVWDVAHGVRCGTCERLLEMPPTGGE